MSGECTEKNLTAILHAIQPKGDRADNYSIIDFFRFH